VPSVTSFLKPGSGSFRNVTGTEAHARCRSSGPSFEIKEHLMHRSTALTAFAALGLTVIAGLSAAAVTIDHGGSVASSAPVQYVDQFGNPVVAPGADTTASAAGSTDRTPTSVVRDTDDGDHEEDGD
jgi:hypothetical protein